MTPKISEKNFFLLIIFVGVLAKIISLFLLPQQVYNDALFHIFVTDQVLANSTFELINLPVPPPFFYSALGSVFLLSGLIVNIFTAKIFGIIAIFLQLVLAFLLFKKIFPNNFLAPLAFFVLFPWVTRFTSTAYPESLTLVFVLAAILFTVKIAGKKIVSLIDLIPLALVIGAAGLSKLNGTILVIAFIPAVIFLLWKKNVSKRTIAIFGIITIFLSGFWFGLNYLNFGQFDQHIAEDVYNFGAETGFSVSSVLSNAGAYYIYFWDFPNASAFLPGSFLSNVGFFETSILFFFLTLPIFAVLLIGAKKLLMKKNYLAILVFLGIILAFVPVVQRIAYYRLIIPAVPFFAILFGFGFNELKEKTKSIAILSIIGFALFSVLYVTGSAYYYDLSQKTEEPLFEQISKLSENSVILIEANKTRTVEYVLGKKAVGVSSAFTPEFLNNNEEEFYKTLKDNKISHVAVSCKKNPFNQKVLENLLQKNFLNKIFEDDCSKLFQVN